MDKNPIIGALISFCIGSGLQVSGYQNIYAAYFFWTVALILGIYSVRSFIPLGRFSTMMPLKDASKKAYTELRGSLWSEAAERLAVDKSPEGILDYIALGIALEVQIYGKWSPSTKVEPIDKKYFNRGSVGGGGQVLRVRDDHPTLIEDLSIKKTDLKTAISRMRNDSDFSNH